jgi:hypothetical protein
MKVRAVPLLLGALFSMGLVACGSDSASGTSNALHIVEKEYGFEVDGDLNAGAITIDVRNSGKEAHMASFGKLTAGKTVADARVAMKNARPDDQNPLNGLLEEDTPLDDVGNLQFPGTALQATAGEVVPGNYLLICFLPDSSGKPHAALGMMAGITVKDKVEKKLPKADVTFTAGATKTTGPATVDAGETTIEVRNTSGAAREIILAKVKKGKTTEDVDAYFKEAGDNLPDLATSPLEFFALVFDAKQTRYLTADLTPGQWALAVQDPDKSSELPVAKDPAAVLFTVR